MDDLIRQHEAGEKCRHSRSFVIMAVKTERSCWGIARLSFGVFLAAIVLVYLFGGFEPIAVVASR